MRMMAQQPVEPVLDVEGDGPVEAEVVETKTPTGQTIVEKRIKKG